MNKENVINGDDPIEVIADRPEDLETLELDKLDLQELKQKVDFYRNKNKNIFKKSQLSTITENITTDMTGSDNPAQQQVVEIIDKSDLQLLLQAVPEYYPGQNLSIFINEVDNLTKHLNKRLTVDQVYACNAQIRSKIKGEARDFIAFMNAVDWSQIRAALLQKYGDQRSEEILTTALTQCVQKRNESYMEYYGNLLKCFNDLMQYISLHTEDQAYLAYKKLDYQKLALKTFTIGLLEPYRSYVSHFDIQSIEEAISKCQTLDNRKQEWDYCEFLRKSSDTTNKKHTQTFRPNTHTQNFRPIQNTNFSSNVQPNFQQNFGRNFTQAPQQSPFMRPQLQYNVQPRGFSGNINKPLPNPQRIPTSKEVFGQKSNASAMVSKPNSNFFKNRQPTPMSTTSTYTMPQNQSKASWPPNQQPQPQQNPGWTFEELYNVEADQQSESYQYQSSEDYVDYSYTESPIIDEPSSDCQTFDDENFQITASEESNT